MNKKEKSWTRQDYERAYRLMRSDVDWDLKGTLWTIPKEIREAADYSYQARDYNVVHGWSNTMRYKWFKKNVWRILTEREVFPF